MQKIGVCPYCGNWNTFIEEKEETQHKFSREKEVSKISLIQTQNLSRITSGIKEIDEILGGGVVPASVILIAGAPGIGKSTLLLQIADAFQKNSEDYKVLYVSGEESPFQIKLRSQRLKKGADILFMATQNLEELLYNIEKIKPKIVIIDSIQSITPQAGLVASTSSLKEVAFKILSFAKEKGITFFISGHITKEGQIQGPKIIEHMVDVVFYLEESSERYLRILYSTKNRYGNTLNFILFQMTSEGLRVVDEPSLIFLEGRKSAPGSAIYCAWQGGKTFLTEIQCLLSPSVFQYPRRQFTGLDINRAYLVLAILMRYAELKLSNFDVFLNVIGGTKITEPACDVAIASSIISAFEKKSLPQDAVFIGELGLGGEIRPVMRLEERLRKASTLGFKKAFIPKQKIHFSGKLNVFDMENILDLKKIWR